MSLDNIIHKCIRKLINEYKLPNEIHFRDCGVHMILTETVREKSQTDLFIL